MANIQNKKYSKYLHSSHWEIKKKELREKYNYRCYVCLSGKTLNTHHLKYNVNYTSILGNEKHKHLILLCGSCHRIIHKFHKYLSPFHFEKIKKLYEVGYSKEDSIRFCVLKGAAFKYLINLQKAINNNDVFSIERLKFWEAIRTESAHRGLVIPRGMLHLYQLIKTTDNYGFVDKLKLLSYIKNKSLISYL